MNAVIQYRLVCPNCGAELQGLKWEPNKVQIASCLCSWMGGVIAAETQTLPPPKRWYEFWR